MNETLKEKIKASLPTLKTLLEHSKREGCPFLEQSLAHSEDELDCYDEVETLTGGLESSYGHRVSECVATGEPLCYLEQGTLTQPQVSCKEECSVYKQALEFTVKYKSNHRV